MTFYCLLLRFCFCISALMLSSPLPPPPPGRHRGYQSHSSYHPHPGASGEQGALRETHPAPVSPAEEVGNAHVRRVSRRAWTNLKCKRLAQVRRTLDSQWPWAPLFTLTDSPRISVPSRVVLSVFRRMKTRERVRGRSQVPNVSQSHHLRTRTYPPV